MNVEIFVFNPFYVNTYLLIDENEAILIDPGFYTVEEFEFFQKFIEQKRLILKNVIITHFHIDHFIGYKFLKDVSFYLSELDEYLKPFNLSFSPFFGDVERGFIYHNVTDEMVINLKNNIIKFIHTPGHSKGHMCLFIENENILFSGDLLFKGTVGRTDLPGGDYNQLLKSIEKILKISNKETLIYPGHGEMTTCANELAYNPFLSELLK